VCDTEDAKLRGFLLSSSATIQSDGLTSRWPWELTSLFPIGTCSAAATAFSCTGSTTGAHTGQSCAVQNDIETFITFATPFVAGETVTCSVAADTLADSVPTGAWTFSNLAVSAQAFTNTTSGGDTAENLLTVANMVAGTCPECSATRPWSALLDLDTTTEEGSAGNATITSFTGEHDLGSTKVLDNFEAFCDSIGTWRTQTVTVRTKLNSGDSYVDVFTDQTCNANQWFVFDLGSVSARFVQVEFACESGCGGTQAREIFVSETPQVDPSPGSRQVAVQGGTLTGGRVGAIP
jgi:hypothetical protein